MSEPAIASTPWPRTRASLARDLRELGLHPGMTVIVHSSLSSLGWVCGGAVAVVQALIDVVTADGTIVMPTHCINSDPARWQHPPVPEAWWPIIREHTPAYDPQVTPTHAMGRIVEVFRTWPGTLRSAHPALSFAAWGHHAEFVTSGHALDYSLGEQSPLARVYDLDGWVLLLGVGYDRNTSFHLAEYRAPGSPEIEEGAAVLEEGRSVWKRYRDVDLDASPFADLGADFEQQSGAVRRGHVGSALARLFRQRPAVDFAVRWLSERRARQQEFAGT